MGLTDTALTSPQAVASCNRPMRPDRRRRACPTSRSSDGSGRRPAHRMEGLGGCGNGPAPVVAVRCLHPCTSPCLIGRVRTPLQAAWRALSISGAQPRNSRAAPAKAGSRARLQEGSIRSPVSPRESRTVRLPPGSQDARGCTERAERSQDRGPVSCRPPLQGAFHEHVAERTTRSSAR